MWIYLTRHAETDGNANRVVQMPDTPLSVRGERQAAQFAAAYFDLPISTIVSSDYARTHATAVKLHTKLLSKFNDKLKQTISDTKHDAKKDTKESQLVVSKLLRERNFGDLRGRAYDDIPKDIFAQDYLPPAGESYSDFVVRIRAAWQEIIALANREQGDVLVMTHGLVVRCILSEILALSPEVLANTDIQNTSVTKISIKNNSNISLLCDVAHLRDEALTKRE